MKKYLLFISLVFISFFMWSCNSSNPDELTDDENEALKNSFKYQFADKVNFFTKTYSNFLLSNEYSSIKAEEFNPDIHLTIKNYTTINFYGNNNNKTTKMSAKVKAIFDDGSIKELSEKKYPADSNSTIGTKTGVLYLFTDYDLENYIDVMDYDVSYNVSDDEENYNLEFSKKFLNLSKDDLKLSYKNDIVDASYEVNIDGEKTTKKIFRSFEITKVQESDKTSIIKMSFTINSEVDDKYFLDIQLFGVDKLGHIYEMFGIYNLSNNAILAYSMSSKFSEYIELSDIYVKAMFVDENEKKHELMYKERYMNL